MLIHSMCFFSSSGGKTPEVAIEINYSVLAAYMYDCNTCICANKITCKKKISIIQVLDFYVIKLK